MNKFMKLFLTVVLLMPVVSTSSSLAAPQAVQKQPAAKSGAAKSSVGAIKDKKKRANLKAKAGGVKTAPATGLQPTTYGSGLRETKRLPRSVIVTGTPATVDTANVGGFLGGAFMVIIGVCLVLGLLVIISMWKVFEKAGEAGWQCLIPIYNVFILTRICQMPTWSIVVMILPYVNFIGGIWMAINLAKVFGKSTPYALGLIFLPMFFYPHLAFSDAQYVGAGGGTPPPGSVPYQMVS